MARLTPVFIDYETFWDVGHSLSKMNPIEYVTHPETEIISCSAKVGRDRTTCTFGEAAVIKQFQNFDWSDKFLIAHNNEGFDAMIAAWRCGARPAMWGCTLAMARPHHAKTIGLSLGALATHYGVGVKDSTALVNTKGKHLKDFTPEELEAMRVYNIDDVELCAGIFQHLLPKTPKDELRLIDMTIRMLVDPQFVVDERILLTTLAEERERKRVMLLDTATMLGAYHPGMTDDDVEGAVRKTLGSAPKFAKLLTDLGVEPPMKPSPTNPEKMTYALAKTDEAFTALVEHDDPIIAAAASARLGVKSTLLETRIEAFLGAARAAGGKLPIPTKYYGADTTGRRSGWGYNPLNLPRVIPGQPKPGDALRKALLAPPDHLIVVADLSGIELRVNMFLWKVQYAMELFKADPAKADLYKALAADVFHITPQEVQKMQRQAGKCMHLGCGFGLGNPEKFRTIARTMASMEVTAEEAKFYISGYRNKHPEIVTGWKTCHGALDAIHAGAEVEVDPWGLCVTCAEGIRTPKGMIRYPKLRKEMKQELRPDGSVWEKPEWVYGEGRNKARIYAGKVDENIVQHLARTVICDVALDIEKETKYKPALEVYDELVYVAHDSEAEDLLERVQARMRTPPTWWPELVTWSEGDMAACYGDAK